MLQLVWSFTTKCWKHVVSNKRVRLYIYQRRLADKLDPQYQRNNSWHSTRPSVQNINSRPWVVKVANHNWLWCIVHVFHLTLGPIVTVCICELFRFENQLFWLNCICGDTPVDLLTTNWLVLFWLLYSSCLPSTGSVRNIINNRVFLLLQYYLWCHFAEDLFM